MSRLFVSFSFVVSLWASPALARDLKTMRFENDLPRPAGVAIDGVQPDQVVLYCTDSVVCKGLRDHLRKTGVAFLDKDPQNDPQAGTEFDALGGQGVPLVVFKQRLMHGYYPISFDKLYAQYHTAPVSASPQLGSRPVAATPTQPVTTGAIATAVVPGRGIDVVAPAAFATYIQSHPDVLVQFTSPDRGCTYCVDGSFEAFNTIASTHATKSIQFARVQWSPWHTFPKGLQPTTIYGIPTQILFRNGQSKDRFEGNIGSPERLQKFRTWLEPHLGTTQ
ncbi:thioredoxin domain-containing protein [Rhodoferax ferrireducens]|uniref:thioredoxin domain-containing protein n=1 Tax=Rhodoferax ferrireducens TaxID=192843 RepID=UPI000E0DA493|nr:thioredoxin family protein [Rhodoferax ferrireducens]